MFKMWQAAFAKPLLADGTAHLRETAWNKGLKIK